MPSQEEWILNAARLFPSPTPDYIRTTDVPLVLICLDIDDEDLSIRRALGVGRVREIPVANLVRVLSPILPAENSASERYTMFKTFDKYETGTVGLPDLQRVAVGAGLLTARECSRIMSTVANTGKGITFDYWCYILKDETGEEEDMKKTDLDSFLAQTGNLNKSQGSEGSNNVSGTNSPQKKVSKGSSRIGGDPNFANIQQRSRGNSRASSQPSSPAKRAVSPVPFMSAPSPVRLEENETVPMGMN